MDWLKIWSLEHKYEATKTQLPRKTDGAQSSIDKKLILSNEIGSQAWHLAKGP
jgi:hypothetical protein